VHGCSNDHIQHSASVDDPFDQNMPSAIIVDDSPIMRAQLRRVLTEAGFRVSAEAGNAEKLVDLYAEHTPDVVTLDIVMPGTDGATAARELLLRFPDAKVVMCSSISAREKILACQQAGVRTYLLKPFKPEHAVAVFRSLAERSAPAAAAATTGEGVHP